MATEASGICTPRMFSGARAFDLQVGNPPWIKPRWEESPFLAEHEPWFMLMEKPTQAERSRRRSELLEAGPVRRYMLRETRDARRVALASNGTPAIPATQSHPTNRRSAMTG